MILMVQSVQLRGGLDFLTGGATVGCKNVTEETEQHQMDGVFW